MLFIFILIVCGTRMTRIKRIYADFFVFEHRKNNHKAHNDLRKGHKVDALLCVSTENLCPCFIRKTKKPLFL
ncbi:hypothetical protein EAH81_17430 [Flavobacterium pectinovorum]|uniref:Uncharacterized protein n=1 Tax=Flavobacterium pectinovorum TaxID=29533 RepID=A0A502EMC4_9FLAO|nr:hypothetical protein EAH81_17430 [Flavobacterium pectinovorum]